jgi:hypothetical protein
MTATNMTDSASEAGFLPTDAMIEAGRKELDRLMQTSADERATLSAVYRATQAARATPPVEMVERVARAHSPDVWAIIDGLRRTEEFYRSKIGKVGYRDGSAEREMASAKKLADEYEGQQLSRATAALAAASLPDETLLAEVRAERDALLQQPIDLAKMHSVDEDANDKMVAYYWHGQAQDARERARVAREALDDLQQAEAEYRLMHDRHGDGSQAAGRAWDLMRRAGDNARDCLASLDEGEGR